MAKQAGYACVMSHRSGETEDMTIADTVRGLQHRPDQDRRPLPVLDRVAKYNQLIRMEDELGASADYAGNDAFYSISK